MYSKLVFAVLFAIPLFSWGQKAFLSQIDNQNRAYLYTSSRTTPNHNKPLLIILHDNESTAQATFYSRETWNSISSEVNLVFPVGWKNQWKCTDSIQILQDARFLENIITNAYSNYKVNRNRVYLIAINESNCVAEAFKETFPDMIAQSSSLTTTTPESVINQIEQLLESESQTDTTYQLYETPRPDKYLSTMDSLKIYSYSNRWVLGLHFGGFYIMQSAQTEITDQTFMDISNAHSFMGVEVTKWRDGHLGWYLDISRLKIPKEQKLSRYTVSTGGGYAMPVTVGIKYELKHHYFYKPYVMLGAGFAQLLVAGGRIATSSNVADLRDKIEKEIRWTYQGTLGAGIDFRFGKRIVTSFQTRYMHSGKFESAGSIDALRAFNFNFFLSYILNANDEESLQKQLRKVENHQ